MMELFSAQKVEHSHVVRKEEIAWFLRQVLECAKKKQVVDVGAELMKLTNNTTCRMLMNMRYSNECDESVKIIGCDIKVRDYYEILEKVLKQHEASPKIENEDLMDILLKVHQDHNAEFKITRTHLKAILLDLFGAGTGTSGEAMGWIIAELINHPNAYNKVREEIKYVVGNARLVEELDVQSLPYLQAVVKEALRLHPPVPIVVRECRKDCKIKEFDIPEITVVAINVYAINRDPEIWDNANDFWPERFLVSSKEKDVLNYIPFGGGRRGCPGSKLALSLMHTTIAAIVQCFDWKVGGEGGDGKVNMEVGIGISLPMAQPFISLPIVHFNPFTSSI
uniref:Cytochrome P450 n=1 Tax=Fagus sylvatica TaxID=28930 RepID=A0A2N9HCZ7_FAGSY